MRERLLEILVCPADEQSLTLSDPEYVSGEIRTASLRCGLCGKNYPVVDFIPRFVERASYAESFGYEWKWFRTVQIDNAKRANSLETFIEKTGFTEDFLRGKLVLDVGVGAGRYADIASRWDAEVVGIDLSSAVDAARQNLKARPNVHIVQADLFLLPFRKESFDVVYSIGVLHHTPDTRSAFEAVSRKLKKGGTIAIWLYERWSQSRRKSLTSLAAIRKVTSRLSPSTLYYLTSLSIVLYYVYKIPVIGLLQRYLPVNRHSNWRWRWLNTFDEYSPTYQWFHTYPEVYRWFRGNFREIELLDAPLSIRGTK